MVKQQGLTLIEMMIATLILAILVTIAIPSYERYKIKVNRVATQAEMVEIGAALQQYLVSHRSFIKDGAVITWSDLSLSNQLPRSEPGLYSVSMNLNGNAWTLIAAPQAQTRQEGDGFLVLNSKGYRCWEEKSTTACAPSATTNWDGR